MQSINSEVNGVITLIREEKRWNCAAYNDRVKTTDKEIVGACDKCSRDADHTGRFERRNPPVLCG